MRATTTPTPISTAMTTIKYALKGIDGNLEDRFASQLKAFSKKSTSTSPISQNQIIYMIIHIALKKIKTKAKHLYYFFKVISLNAQKPLSQALVLQFESAVLKRLCFVRYGLYKRLYC